MDVDVNDYDTSELTNASDELDSATSQAVFELLRSIHAERGTSFVIVTHDPRLAAGCDRMVELIDGQVASDGLSAPAGAG